MKGHSDATGEVAEFNWAQAQADRQLWIAAFASAVCWLRKQARLTRKQLAGRLGVKPDRVVGWEKGKRPILASDIFFIARACNSDVQVLWERAYSEASLRGWEPKR